MEEAALVRTQNEDKSRFEIHIGGELAGFVLYRRQGKLLDLIHTEVGERFQGHGAAGELARFSLDTARAQGLDVLPSCPYIRKWIGLHPDYLDLVPPERRAEFGLSA